MRSSCSVSSSDIQARYVDFIDTKTDYAYTARALLLQNEKGSLELGLEMLSLSREWKMEEAQRAVQNAIITSKIVDPYTLDRSESYQPLVILWASDADLQAVRAIAACTESQALLYHCNDFEAHNTYLVRRVKEKGLVTALN